MDADRSIVKALKALLSAFDKGAIPSITPLPAGTAARELRRLIGSELLWHDSTKNSPEQHISGFPESAGKVEDNLPCAVALNAFTMLRNPEYGCIAFGNSPKNATMPED